MRDRRNTSLSISSTSSADSAPSSYSSRTSMSEKRTLSPPPPSPSLPPPVAGTARMKSQSGRSTAIKLLAAVCLILIFLHILRVPLPDSIRPGADAAIEIVGGDSLPDEPTALIVADSWGYSKWTISIPHDYGFPLYPQEYKDLCSQGQTLRDSITQATRLDRFGQWRWQRPYYSKDRSFMDVADAEKGGVLPMPEEKLGKDVCDSSLTFALDTDDASFGKTLLMLWLSYGLAEKEGRSFFIDDTRWPYGNYTSYFTPLPSQGCMPPPAHHIVPCPHQAKHLLVSAATAPWTFGFAFHEIYAKGGTHGVERMRQIYDMIRTGYDALFHLIGEDAVYATARIAKMKEDAAANNTSILGIQIRRGDLHPFEFQFSDHEYLPFHRYTIAARNLFKSLPAFNTPHNDGKKERPETPTPEPFLLLASDDPVTIASPDLTPFSLKKAQERIQLATKAALDRTSPARDIAEPGSAYVKHVDENSGWEGGFYSALFFSLGRQPQKLQHHHYSSVSEQGMHMRELVGRAYLLDLAVLGQGSEGVVCAVSSAGCRILGVMMGWEAVSGSGGKGKEGRRWVNVDDGRAWSWDGWH